MKKVKRKYVRKVSQIVTEPVSDSVKGGSSIIGAGGEILSPKSEFSFEDLPLSTRTFVERVIKYRKARGLPDDSKIRKERAIKYFRGDRPR